MRCSLRSVTTRAANNRAGSASQRNPKPEYVLARNSCATAREAIGRNLDSGRVPAPLTGASMFDDIAAAVLEWFGFSGDGDLPDAVWEQGEGMGING